MRRRRPGRCPGKPQRSCRSVKWCLPTSNSSAAVVRVYGLWLDLTHMHVDTASLGCKAHAGWH